MPTIEKQAIRFLAKNDTISNDAELLIKHFDQKDCIKRALTRLGLCWLASIASLPIIFAHWVLVPGFFIAGPIVAVSAYRTKQINDRTMGECPACKKPIEVKLEPKESLPKWTYCPLCKDPLHIAHCQKP